MSLAFSHRTQNMIYKRVCRDCPISGCGAKYLVRLANHLADVNLLDHKQRRQHLEEVKLHSKVKVIVHESKEGNSRNNHGTTTCTPATTQKNINELSRSRRNEASFKAKPTRLQRENSMIIINVTFRYVLPTRLQRAMQ